MSHTTLTALRDNMASYFDRVTEDHEPLIVSRPAGKGNVVVMAEDDFAGWQETVHLLSSPRNAERMLRAKKQLDAGGGKVRQLVRS
jgi:antitoxin YefM